MRKFFLGLFVLCFCLFTSSKALSQTLQTAVDVNNLINDALYYSQTFITPATDAAVYQSSSAWVVTPQKKKLWDVGFSLNANAFFVPKSQRKFTIHNSDFSFFKIENGAQSAEVPTALGNSNQIYMVGSIDDGTNQNEVRLKTPEGISMDAVVYPYLQASLGLPYGLELVAKYSTNVKLKKGHYQVYGAGLKYNLSQYFKKMEAKQMYLSVFAGISKEEISFEFLNAQTEQYGSLGLNQIAGLVNTYQLQFNGSKRWNKFEAMAGVITNLSAIKYEVNGDTAATGFLVPVQSYLNSRLSEIYTTKFNAMGELSGRYQFGGHFHTQLALALGKFVNTNLSLQYEL